MTKRIRALEFLVGGLMTRHNNCPTNRRESPGLQIASRIPSAPPIFKSHTTGNQDDCSGDLLEIRPNEWGVLGGIFCQGFPQGLDTVFEPQRFIGHPVDIHVELRDIGIHQTVFSNLPLNVFGNFIHSAENTSVP